MIAPGKSILIAGPTGSGKSELALRLAEGLKDRGGAWIINADSQQVYRELRVLTARPTPVDEARAPHRLYGILPATDPCSAGRWRGLALDAVAGAWRAGRVPIVVGGTGLYFRALTHGLAPVPAIPAASRQAARERLARLGAEAFHRELGERDPRMAARLVPADAQRMIRASEVLEATGTSLAQWQAGASDATLPGVAARFVLAPPREALYERLDRRLQGMIERGVLAEVAALRERALDPELPAMKAQGLRQLMRHLEGELSLEDALAAAQAATRRYAKRQLTWQRHQMRDWTRIEAQHSGSFFERIFPIVCPFLLTETQ